MTLHVRPAVTADVPAMVVLINAIIATGGTTAHQTPFTEAAFAHHYLTGPDAMACHVALLDGALVGFQVLDRWPGLPEDWADIGTFVAEAARGTGAGDALFAATLALARAQGVAVINATIRADNRLGVGYYHRIGFTDYARDPDWALDDGTRVGRVSKRRDIA